MFSYLDPGLSFCAYAETEAADMKRHAASAIYKNLLIVAVFIKHTKIALNFGKFHIFGKNVPGMQHQGPVLHL
jgi:hypothetical protein